MKALILNRTWKIPDFHNRSYSDVSGKYQYKEKAIKTSEKTLINQDPSEKGSTLKGKTLEQKNLKNPRVEGAKQWSLLTHFS